MTWDDESTAGADVSDVSFVSFPVNKYIDI